MVSLLAAKTVQYPGQGGSTLEYLKDSSKKMELLFGQEAATTSRGTIDGANPRSHEISLGRTMDAELL